MACRRLTVLALCVATLETLMSVSGTSAPDTCSPFLYPGPEDVDIKLVAIYGMHSSMTCTDQPSENAIQLALAMHWALDMLNGDNATESFIPGVKIGMDIYDDCNQEYLSARHAGSVAMRSRDLAQCVGNDQASTTLHAPIAGIIGTTRSQTTTMVTEVARATNIPVVGISATLAELSDKSKYPGFVRTVPSDNLQAEAIIALALKFNWSYIVGIFSNDNYGQMGMTRLQALAADHRICVSVVNSLDILGTIDEDALYTFTRNTLLGKVKMSGGTLGVVYFGQDEGLVRFLHLVKTWSAEWIDGESLKRIHWVVSDAVSLDSHLIDLVKGLGSRIVGLDPRRTIMQSFRMFQGQFLTAPPAWAVEGRWHGVLKQLATQHYGCENYNLTSESAVGCDLGGPSSYSGYLTTAMDAVYLLANTLKEMHSQYCTGQAGLCEELRAALNDGLLSSRSLAQLDYSSFDPAQVPPEFVATGRALVPDGEDFLVQNQSLYSILANEGDIFVEIGTYANGSVDLQQRYEDDIPNSVCTSICEECHHLDAMSYEFVDGDYVILGIFSVHWRAGDASFKCGAFRGEGRSFTALNAFLNSVEQLRKTTGINFGYLAIDDCYNPLVINRMLSKIMSSDLRVTCKFSNVILDPRKIVVAIGAQSSPVTIAVLPMLQNLNIPLISYSSTNPVLDNRITYPYFSRTVISDTKQAYALSLILQQLNVTYVGAIVYGNAYGRALYQIFREKAEARGICVAEAFEVTDKTTTSDFKPLLQSYRNSETRVIIAFVFDKVIQVLSDAVIHEDTFVFLGSEAWARNAKVVEGDRGEKVRGSLTLEPMGFDVDYGFKEYVDSWERSDTESNDWLRQFWEMYFECNLPRGFNNIHQTSCPTRRPYFSPSALTHIEEEPLVVHTTVGTIAAGMAVKKLVGDVTRKPEDVLPLDPEELSKTIREVTLQTSDNSQFKPFLPTGNGNGGLRVYNVQQEPGTDEYTYVPIGDFREDLLKLDLSKLRFYDITGQIVETVESTCQYRKECAEVCRSPQSPADTPTTLPTGPQPKDEQESDDGPDIIVIILGIFVGLLVLIIVVIIVLVCLTCTGRLSWSKARHYSNTSWGVSSSVQEPPYPDFRRQYNVNGSSSSSANESRPPLPLRKRKDTASTDMLDCGRSVTYTNKAFSDIISHHPAESARHSDDENSRSRSHTLPRPVGATKLSIPAEGMSDRLAPSPHSGQSIELAGSLASSSSAPSSGSHCDNPRFLQVTNLDGIPIQSVGPVHQYAGSDHQMSSTMPSKLIQQQQQHLQTLPPEQKYPQPHHQIGRFTYRDENSQSVKPDSKQEEARHQQQLAILHALQQKDLDENLRQQYLWLLYQTQHPNQPLQGPQLQNQPLDSQNAPRNMAYHHQQQPAHGPQVQELGGQSHVVLDNPEQAVFFSNLSGASAVYTIPSSPRSVVSSKDPEYIYVLTAEGLAPIPYENGAGVEKASAIRQSQDDLSKPQRGHNSDPRYTPSHSPYAQILYHKPGEPTSHPYAFVDGQKSDEDVRAMRGTQQGNKDHGNAYPPPQPHKQADGIDYLTPLPDSGQNLASEDLGPGIPGLVELPKEVFQPRKDQATGSVTPLPVAEKSRAASSRGDGLYTVPVRNAKPLSTGAVTYTVESSDYPVKMDQTRMSAVPQMAHQHSQQPNLYASNVIERQQSRQTDQPGGRHQDSGRNGGHQVPAGTSKKAPNYDTIRAPAVNSHGSIPQKPVEPPPVAMDVTDQINQDRGVAPRTAIISPDNRDVQHASNQSKAHPEADRSRPSSRDNVNEAYHVPPSGDTGVHCGPETASSASDDFAADGNPHAESDPGRERHGSSQTAPGGINSRTNHAGDGVSSKKPLHGNEFFSVQHPDILENLTESNL